MRHGRKSSSKRFDGYKRHVLMDLDERLVLAVETLPANMAEHRALDSLLRQVQAQNRELVSLHTDRGYLAAHEVPVIDKQGVLIVCRPWPNRRGDHFSKADFEIDLTEGVVTCSAGQ